MQTSNRNSVEAALQSKAIQSQIDKTIDESLSPAIKENEMLKLQVEQLQKELSESETKFGTVRQQLQILHFFFDLGKLTQYKNVELVGNFFSVVLNRHPQRARKQFSAFGELFYSANKETAKNIRKDLMHVKKLLSDFGLAKKVKLVEGHIKRLEEKHGFEDL